jgi:hypothetical protein
MSPTPISLTPEEYNQPHVDTMPSATGTSADGDWYYHAQSIEFDYFRENMFDSGLSNAIVTPTVVSNRLRIEYTINVTDRIVYDAVFSNNLRIAEQFEFTDGGPTLGATGSIASQTQGIVRRPARKDSRTSAILDPIGICNQSGVIYLDERSGVFDGTEINVNTLLIQLTNYFAEICPLYDTSLISI